MGNRWEIIDKNGTIHSGTEEEMRTAWNMMNRDIYSVTESDEMSIEFKKYMTTWQGDLKLVEIHAITK